MEKIPAGILHAVDDTTNQGIGIRLVCSTTPHTAQTLEKINALVKQMQSNRDLEIIRKQFGAPLD